MGGAQLSRSQSVLVIAWLLLNLYIAYHGFGRHITLFLTIYGPRYFPLLAGVLW